MLDVESVCVIKGKYKGQKFNYFEPLGDYHLVYKDNPSDRIMIRNDDCILKF